MRRLVPLLLALATTGAVNAQAPAPLDTVAVVPDDAHLADITEAGRVAGEIEACGFDWQTYYLAYMQSERRRATHEGRDPGSRTYGQRMAFIGTFFGAQQGQALAEADGKACSREEAIDLANRAVAILDAARDRERADGE